MDAKIFYYQAIKCQGEERTLNQSTSGIRAETDDWYDLIIGTLVNLINSISILGHVYTMDDLNLKSKLSLSEAVIRFIPFQSSLKHPPLPLWSNVALDVANYLVCISRIVISLCTDNEYAR